MRLLVVEDEIPLADSMAELLRKQKYDVDIANDGEYGEEYALTALYDAIILDILLPKKDGLAVLRSLRGAGLATPILLLTAKSGVNDKVHGLDMGADDYLCKPFDPKELCARIRALTRRLGRYESEELAVGETTLDKTRQYLRCRDKSVKLSRKEFLMLEILMTNESKITSKELLFAKVWGYNSETEYNAVDVYISFIRRKLEAIDSNLRIKAARGTGYILEEADT